MRLRAALIGCGQMSRAWLESAAKIDGLEIVGLGDIDRDRAQARADEFGLSDIAICENIDSLLRETRPDILFDVVVPEARHAIVAAGLAAGCHVLSEKPMAASLAEARDLLARAAKAAKLHAIVQNRRYLSAVRRIARLVASGAIGEVTSVHADFFLGPHFGGFREEMDHVLLLDMAIHAFDTMRCMTDLSTTGVYCREWEPKSTWYRQGSSAIAVFDLANGGLFTYRGSWAADGARTSWECAWRIIGTLGTLVWDGNDQIQAEIAGVRNGLLAEPISVPIPEASPDDRTGGHLGVLRDFINAIRTGSEPETTGKENIKSLAMVFGAINSAEQGGRIDIII